MSPLSTKLFISNSKNIIVNLCRQRVSWSWCWFTKEFSVKIILLCLNGISKTSYNHTHKLHGMLIHGKTPLKTTQIERRLENCANPCTVMKQAFFCMLTLQFFSHVWMTFQNVCKYTLISYEFSWFKHHYPSTLFKLPATISTLEASRHTCTPPRFDAWLFLERL